MGYIYGILLVPELGCRPVFFLESTGRHLFVQLTAGSTSFCSSGSITIHFVRADTSAVSRGRYISCSSFASASRGVQGCSLNSRPNSGITPPNGLLILSPKPRGLRPRRNAYQERLLIELPDSLPFQVHDGRELIFC